MSSRKPLPKNFFARDADIVARALIGATLTFGGVGGIIVETESYDTADPASHAFLRRQTKRNAVIFGPPGHAYVYRIYGMHWCLNFVCSDASALLVRALEPQVGIAKMQARRGTDVAALLCSGPGRLCQALAIGGAQNGLSLYAPPFLLYRAADPAELSVGPRIGITKGILAQRRFGLARSRFVSRRFPDP
ncbi:MAG: DNA-3-methyladenine glycosylase [Rhizomicrobium sp.]